MKDGEVLLSRLVQVLVVFGVVLTGGGVALTLSAGGSGEGLSIFFLLGISAIFVLYAQGLLRWTRKHWHHAPPELPDNPDRPEGWATLEERYQDSPLLPSLRYFGTTLLRRSRGGQVELLRTSDAQQIIHAESPYVPEPSRLPGWLGTGQAVLVTLGLIGTFLGMTIGLFQAIPLLQGATPDPDQAMNLLLGGARLAFTKSVAGMYWSIVWLFMYRDAEQRYQNAFADLGGAVDQAIPRVRTETLLLELGEERFGKLEAAVLGLAGRPAVEPRTVPSPSPSAAGGGIDPEPMLQLLRSIDSRLAERGDQRGLQALEAAADRLSLAAGRMGELGERLPAMLQARPAAPAPVSAPAAAPVDLNHAGMIQEISRVTKEFQSAGEAFTRSLGEANLATVSALHPLQELSRNLQSSSAAFQAQQETLEQLRTSLAAERAGLEALLRSCEGLTGGVQQQLHSHVEAMERSIRLLEGGYQSAQEQSLANMNAWQRQMLEFLPELERRLQFPGYVKELEQALTLESESRKDLTDLLRRLGAAR
jgi:hypothetical protein